MDLCNSNDLSNRASSNEVVSAGKIQTLGLDAIKQRLGNKWDRMSDLVHRYFEVSIRQEMRSGDTFCHFGELSYLVLFRDVTVAEAQLKCSTVIHDVCQKLFGEQGQEVFLRSHVATTDELDLEDVHARLRLSRFLEEKGRETLFSNNGDAVESASSASLRIKVGTGAFPIHSIPPDAVTFVYRPLWDTSRNVVLTYAAQVLPDTVLPNAPFGSPAIAVDGEDSQTTLDILCLNECLKRASELRKARLRVLLATPFHFSTVCRLRQWPRYRAALDVVPPELFRDIAFIIHGFYEGVPHIRLSQELPKLSKYSKQLFCLVTDTEGAGIRFRNTGAHAVGVTLSPGVADSAWIDRAKLLTKEARDNGLDTFALGALTRSTVVNAIGAGCRYLEGPAVRRAVADPRNAFVHDIDDIYRDRLVGT